MTDRRFVENRAWEEPGGDPDCFIKLKEVADGSYAYAIYDETVEGRLVAIEGKLDLIVACIASGAIKVKIV